MPPLELTPEEEALVLNHRQDRAAAKAKRDFARKAIAITAEFEAWSEKTGEGLTFSTFINTFGYQDNDSNAMYEAVTRIKQAARPID